MVATETGGTVYVIGQPAGGAQDVIGRLVVVEVIAIALALLGGGIAGAVLVRRELRPLERVADTAVKVSALPLDRGEVELAERVRDVDPRTEVGQVASALNQMLGQRRAARWKPGRTARCGCGSSSPTPATSCARRWPPSAATRS